MSADRTPLLSSHFNYMIDHVGGNTNEDNDLDYIKNQNSVIERRNEEIPESYDPPYNDMYTAIPGLFGVRHPPRYDKKKSDKYDPLGEYLFKKGLMDRDNITRYMTHYLNIDSTLRNKTPKVIMDPKQWFILDNNPIKFQQGTNTMTITLPDDVILQKNDKLSITGVPPVKKIITINSITVDDTGVKITKPIIEFKNGSQYAIINYPHQLSFDGLPQAVDGTLYSENIKNQYIINYDTSDLFVDLADIRGTQNKDFINNIPIATLNSTHRVYIFDPEAIIRIIPSTTSKVTNQLPPPTIFISPPYDNNKFYIKLVKKYNESIVFAPIDNYNMSLTFNYYAGIPINRINAEYPISAQTLQGYQLISGNNVDGEYLIDLYKNTAGIFGDGNNGVTSDGVVHNKNKPIGGTNVYSMLVNQLDNTYLLPNHYVINLEETYVNVVLIKMISSEFPNVETMIKNYPPSKANNRLYWQNLEDGSILYSISIDPGNYTPKTLEKEIESKIQLVPRSSTFNTSGIYDYNNQINIKIDGDNSTVSFTSIKSAFIDQPFTDIQPIITSSTDILGKVFTISVRHTDHNLSVGDEVTIENAIVYYGIPETELNAVQIVYQVLSQDTYTIQVQSFNLIRDSTSIPSNVGGSDTKGGFGVKVLSPNVFRLRFDFPDTLGNVLGFRNVGNTLAVSNYDVIITNQDQYQTELSVDEQGNPIVINNNALQLYGDKYILVACTQTDTQGIYTGDTIKNSFAKIILPSKQTNKIFKNTYVHDPIYFHKPIPNLTELEFFFYSPDGELYNFAGSNHSFTLEIVTLGEIPKGTGITSMIGKIN